MHHNRLRIYNTEELLIVRAVQGWTTPYVKEVCSSHPGTFMDSEWASRCGVESSFSMSRKTHWNSHISMSYHTLQMVTQIISAKIKRHNVRKSWGGVCECIHTPVCVRELDITRIYSHLKTIYYLFQWGCNYAIVIVLNSLWIIFKAFNTFSLAI